MKEYICPRCSNVFNNDDDLDLWFIVNAGYVKMGACTNCTTPEEFKVIDKTWKDYRKSMKESNK